MPRRPALMAAGVLLGVVPGTVHGQTPVLLSAPGAHPEVSGVLLRPDGHGKHPAVLLLHGSSGWRADNLELARTLTGAGYVTLTVDYYVETGGAAIGSQEKLAKWPAWQATVRAAVDVLRALPTVDRGAIALLGVSRGAFLAVSVAGSIPSVRAVVDLYGGGGGGTAAIDDEVRNMPPLLILHGEADDIVPPRFAFELRDACRRAGRTVELHTYSGVGHGFSLPAAPNWSRKATDDATRRIIRFLRRWLTAT